MAKEKFSRIYNKGFRAWPFDVGSGDKKKTIFCKPGKSVELPTAKCEKLVEMYPKDFILGDKMISSSASGDIKKLTSLNKKLEKENAELKEELEALKADQSPVTEETKADLEK